MYALILAGGRGERLRPLTDAVAKPMVLLNQLPVLYYQVSRLRNQGITDVVLLCGYKSDSVKEFFGDGSDFGLDIQYSVEEIPLGRGGAIKRGMSNIPTSERTILVMNGDTLTTQEVKPMLDLHQKSDAKATVMLTPYVTQYGLVETDGSGKIWAFREKGVLPYWINAGVYIFDTSLREELPDLGDHEVTTFPKLAVDGVLYAYHSQAPWKSIDTHKDLREAEDAMRLEPLVWGNPH